MFVNKKPASLPSNALNLIRQHMRLKNFSRTTLHIKPKATQSYFTAIYKPYKLKPVLYIP